MSCLLLHALYFSLLLSKCFCSFENLNKKFKNSLERAISDKFHPVVLAAVERNELLVPLLDFANEIKTKFLSTEEVNEKFLENAMEFIENRLRNIGIRNSETIIYLLKSFAAVCELPQREYSYEKMMLMNKKAIKTLADVCHRFKAPVQWLILTSKVLGYPNMFGDAPNLLEIIRKAFLEKFDLQVKYIDFKDKLNFIRNSFDFYFLRRSTEFKVESSLPIYMELKDEFMRLIDTVISELEANSNPVDTLSTGLGTQIIQIDLGSKFTSSTKDLWSFIIRKVENIREIIESECSNLLGTLQKSVIDLIVSNLREKSQSNGPFSLKSVQITISESFNDYMSLIKPVHNYESFEIDILCYEALKAKSLLEEELKKFNVELKAKIVEIESQYDLKGSMFNLSFIAVGSMAFDYLKENNLENFF